MNPTTKLVNAAQRVWDAFLKWGPCDDGTPEGQECEAALDVLMEAKAEVKYSKRSAYIPSLTIRLRCVRVPGGRGRNAYHWEATPNKTGWVNDVIHGRNEAIVVGEVLLSHMRRVNKPPKVTIVYEQG